MTPSNTATPPKVTGSAVPTPNSTLVNYQAGEADAALEEIEGLRSELAAILGGERFLKEIEFLLRIPTPRHADSSVSGSSFRVGSGRPGEGSAASRHPSRLERT